VALSTGGGRHPGRPPRAALAQLSTTPVYSAIPGLSFTFRSFGSFTFFTRADFCARR